MDYSKFNTIKAFVFDVDGVLSDGKLTVQEDDLVRVVSAKDGMGIRIAMDEGYHVFIITGGSSHNVEKRFKELGVQEFHGAIWNKKDHLIELLDKHKINASEVLYCGDDINDLDAIKMCGIGSCPRNAVVDIINNCDYICAVPGGEGCAREVIEKVMRIQNTWPI